MEDKVSFHALGLIAHASCLVRYRRRLPKNENLGMTLPKGFVVLSVLLWSLGWLSLSPAFCQGIALSEKGQVKVASSEYNLVEVGQNDFRISNRVPEGVSGFYLGFPDVVWNSSDQNFLVVWEAEDSNDIASDYNEYKIFGQLLSATGVQNGTNDFTIREMARYYGSYPAVAWNSSDDQYLTVWHHDAIDLLAQRIGPSGDLIGTFLINSTYDAGFPAIAWNQTNKEFLIVWEVDGRVLIGRRFTASGEEIGEELQISDYTPWVLNETAHNPRVVWNRLNNEYLVPVAERNFRIICG